MIKTPKAYCSATDRNVPVVRRAGARLSEPPSARDAEILLCLDFGVRCTGALCPLFTPLRMRSAGELAPHPDPLRMG